MNRLAVGLAFVFLVIFSISATAGEFGVLKSKIADARDPLVTMLKDPSKRGADQQKLVKDSAAAVSDAIAKMKAPAGKEAHFKELKDTWAAFKKTREEELVPLILKGKQAEAEKIAVGVQKDRMKKMNDLCDALDK